MEELPERASGIGRAWQRLQNRREAQKRAVSFQAEQQEQLVSVLLIFVKQERFIAQERFPLEGGSQTQLREKGSRYLIDLSDVRHVPVEALRQPSESDDLDTRVGLSIWASGTLHRVASGWWGRSMHRHDSLCTSPSYHRQGFR